ncbi:hypothetical protein PENSPDRAFT_687029 [Peniophora sp. CONT]|nr:hypothetical protein PENSPDRAFT_687029 [Peniophora sp. CONT]
MPPYSHFIWAVQKALNDVQNQAPWKNLPYEATLFLTGSEGPEPVDTSDFPRWWLDVPRLLGFGFLRAPFDLPGWIIAQSEISVGEALAAEGADVAGFVDQLKDIMQSLDRVQASPIERAKFLDSLHTHVEEVFQSTQAARQHAATVAQRRYEDSHGLPHQPVPLQVPLPKVDNEDRGQRRSL